MTRCHGFRLRSVLRIRHFFSLSYVSRWSLSYCWKACSVTGRRSLSRLLGSLLLRDILEHVFTHVQTLPKSTGDRRTGDVILRLTSDVKTLRDLLVNHVQQLGSYGSTFVSTLAVMLWMNWGTEACSPLWLFRSSPWRVTTSAGTSAALPNASVKGRSPVASIVQENLHSVAVVQAFAQEERERRRFRQEARRSLDASLDSVRLGGAFTRSIKVLNTIGTAMVVWLGASRVLDGTLSPGDLSCSF